MNRAHNSLALVALVAVVSCGSSPPPSTAQCIDSFGDGGNTTFESDNFADACAAAQAGTCGPTVGEVREGCDAAGFPCEGVLLTRQAALCIAEQQGVGEAIRGPYARLSYSARHRRPIWVVENLSAELEDGDLIGTFLEIDATTGEVIGQGQWGATP